MRMINSDLVGVDITHHKGSPEPRLLSCSICWALCSPSSWPPAPPWRTWRTRPSGPRQQAVTQPSVRTPHLVQLPADGRSDLQAPQECEEDAQQDVETSDDESSHDLVSGVARISAETTPAPAAPLLIPRAGGRQTSQRLSLHPALTHTYS